MYSVGLFLTVSGYTLANNFDIISAEPEIMRMDIIVTKKPVFIISFTDISPEP